MVARAPQTGQKLIVWGESKVLVMEPPHNRFVLDYSRKVFFLSMRPVKSVAKGQVLCKLAGKIKVAFLPFFYPI